MKARPGLQANWRERKISMTRSIIENTTEKNNTAALIPACVIGAGHLGQHHIRLLSSIEGVSLQGIVDVDADRARNFARKYGTESFSDFEMLPTGTRAAVVATPTPTHFAITRVLLEKGIHCFVEKPLTETIEEAETLIRLAQEKQLVLQVGHVERFNPAVMEMSRQANDPMFVEASRLGPYDPRVSHIGVVLDLMIHDIDIVLALVRDSVVRLDAVGGKLLSDHPDIVKATLYFSRGCRADLTASRVSIKRYRKIRVFQRDAYMSLDYSEKSLKIYRKKKPVVTSLTDLYVQRPRLDKKKEQLDLELRHFVSCIQEGKPPLVGGQHGRDALEIAIEIQNAMKLHNV
jgi:predicted dehydrogenase